MQYCKICRYGNHQHQNWSYQSMYTNSYEQVEQYNMQGIVDEVADPESRSLS